MKIVQIAASAGELFALSDTNDLFRLVSTVPTGGKEAVLSWHPLPNLPVAPPSDEDTNVENDPPSSAEDA